MSRARCVLFAAAALFAATAARAHEVLHEVEWNRAIAVRAYFPDGEVLAYAQYEVYSPADPKLPHQKGRTDRDGWLAFVPAAPGAWRVKVIDQTGHGLDVAIEAARKPGAVPVASSGAAPASTVAFVLRPLVGLVAIAGVFGALLALHRRKRTSG